MNAHQFKPMNSLGGLDSTLYNDLNYYVESLENLNLKTFHHR